MGVFFAPRSVAGSRIPARSVFDTDYPSFDDGARLQMATFPIEGFLEPYPPVSPYPICATVFR